MPEIHIAKFIYHALPHQLYVGTLFMNRRLKILSRKAKITKVLNRPFSYPSWNILWNKHLCKFQLLCVEINSDVILWAKAFKCFSLILSFHFKIKIWDFIFKLRIKKYKYFRLSMTHWYYSLKCFYHTHNCICKKFE